MATVAQGSRGGGGGSSSLSHGGHGGSHGNAGCGGHGVGLGRTGAGHDEQPPPGQLEQGRRSFQEYMRGLLLKGLEAPHGRPERKHGSNV